MHDKDETMHMGVKNDTNLDDNKRENQNMTRYSSEIEDKKRLVEIYLIISGLLMSGVQVSNALISTSFNSSNISTTDIGKYSIDVTSFFNVVFTVFVISILIYYVSFTVETLNYTGIAPFVSLFFSSLIVSMFNLQKTIHHESNNIYMTFGLWIPLFVISWLTLSSIPQMSNSFLKILNRNKNDIIKINRTTCIRFIFFTVFSYLLSTHMLDI